MRTTSSVSIAFFVALFAVGTASSGCGGRVIDGAFDPADDEDDEDAGASDTPLDGSVDEDAPSWDDGLDDGGPWIDADPVDGSAPDTSIVDTGFDTGSDTSIVDSGKVDTGIVDTGTDTGPDAGPPLATVCNTIATATCTKAFQSCCTSKGFGWDDVACFDVARAWCDDGRDGVAAGKTTYDPAYADACAKAWTAATTACSLHLLDYLENQAACSQMFNGKTAPGGVCTRNTDCHANPGQTAWCDESSKRCRAYQVVGAGASCTYFGATIRYCDTGLYCDFSGAPVCKKATPIGGTCFGVDDTSCGIGNTCRAGKCAKGLAPGASCTRDLECASWECSLGKCTDPNVTVANKFLCAGG